MSSESGTPRHKPLRDRLAFRVALVLVLGLGIFWVSRGCQASGIEISQEEAVAIALDGVRDLDFTPDEDNTQIRLLRQGFTPRWFVSLSETDADGDLVNVHVVEVDAETGEILSIRKP